MEQSCRGLIERLSRHLSGGTEGSYERPCLCYRVSQPELPSASVRCCVLMIVTIGIELNINTLRDHLTPACLFPFKCRLLVCLSYASCQDGVVKTWHLLALIQLLGTPRRCLHFGTEFHILNIIYILYLPRSVCSLILLDPLANFCEYDVIGHLPR